MLAHRVATGDEVHEHAEVGEDDHEDRPRAAFAQPDRSWLRKMSAKTVMSSQIQMKNRKNHIIDQEHLPGPEIVRQYQCVPFCVF